MIVVVHEVAGTRPLLLIATVAFEREIDRIYTRGSKAQLWELPTSAHTKGLQDHPIMYAHRVLSLFNKALLTSATGTKVSARSASLWGCRTALSLRLEIDSQSETRSQPECSP